MKHAEVLTAGQVAAHCQVSYETVKNWVTAGKLQAFLTPGGHRRVRVADFQAFLRQYHLPQHPSAHRRVLIVDDHPGVVKGVCQALDQLGGYQLATAADGFDAGLQLATFCLDLVLLDLRMPQLDGFQVCRKIKTSPQTEAVKVLVMTGSLTEDHLREALACGADGFLSKPFTLADLKTRLAELFQPGHRKAVRSA